MSVLRDLKRLILGTLVAGVAGLIVLLDFMGVGGAVGVLARLLVEWGTLLTALALLVGIMSVAGWHIRRSARREPDRIYSLVLLVAMFGVIIVGILGIPGVTPLPRSLADAPIRTFFRWVYEPLAGSFLALLAFFSLSAILRALRQRRVEALVISAIAIVLLLVQLPPVATLPLVDTTTRWLTDYVALAGARALLIGAAIGTLVAGVRVLLGFDQPYLDR